MTFKHAVGDYNTRTKEISGCKKYSLTWYHELRHSQQDKVGILLLYSYYIILVPFFIIGYYINIYTAIIVYLPTFIIEIDAWIYAIYKKVKKK